MMRFKIDENLPEEVAALLRDAGYDAVTVLDQLMGGCPDGTIGDLVRAENRTLITLDLDFADIRIFPPGNFAGLIVLRLVAQDKSRVLAIVSRLLPLPKIETLIGRLWIVDENAVRVRSHVE
jgi:predicted nuclease of predicted toxin-antitoxin system